jgi:hypothetical protein
VIRTSIAIALCALAFGPSAQAQSVSLVSLGPNERVAMLSTCNSLRGQDRSLCRDVVEDQNVVVNSKRSCLEAMTLLLKGSTWAQIKSIPPTLTCQHGLARAGYPVKDIMRRLAGG